MIRRDTIPQEYKNQFDALSKDDIVKLFARYIDHIIDQEGIDFLPRTSSRFDEYENFSTSELYYFLIIKKFCSEDL